MSEFGKIPKTDSTAVIPEPGKSGSRQRLRLTILLGILFFVVSYPLSIGPIRFLSDKGLIPEYLQSSVDSFQSPLTWIYKRNEYFRVFVEWYLSFFTDFGEVVR